MWLVLGGLALLGGGTAIYFATKKKTDELGKGGGSGGGSSGGGPITYPTLSPGQIPQTFSTNPGTWSMSEALKAAAKLVDPNALTPL
jgi:hypothetical protein